MDSKNFDAITKLAANASDRRNMMKLAGAAALLGTAGFVSRSDDAEAALVTVVITNLLNGLHIDVDVKNNNVAVQVCAVVDALSTSIGLPALTCDIQQ
jgi:hypothetical protein